MAEVRPFRGLRYNLDRIVDLAAVMAPPYDIISPDLQLDYYERDPHNVIRLELTREVPDDLTGEQKYLLAARTLEEWLGEGILVQDERPAIYVYDQEFDLRGGRPCRRGIMVRVRLEPWSKGVVLPHEVTMAGPKLDRLRLLRASRASFSPIFGLYEDPSGEIAALLAAAGRDRLAAELCDRAGDCHRLWIETSSEVAERLSSLLAGQPLYIADGHHRYETALAYRDEQRTLHPNAPADAGFEYVMMLLVDVADPGLVLLPTHRLVGNVAEERLKVFLGGLDRLFVVKEREIAGREDLDRRLGELAELGAGGGCAFGLCGPEPDRFRLLTLRPEHAPGRERSVSSRLDVTVLQRLVLEAELGLTAHAGRAGYLDYTRDEAAALEAVRRGHYQLAFFLNPPPVSAVRDVALARETMPEKSTYFHPKPLTGLVIYPLW